MMLRLLVVVALAIAVPACGTKSDLVMPNGKETPKDKKDPSKPNDPLG